MLTDLLIIKDLASKAKMKLIESGVTHIVLVSNPLKQEVVDENGKKRKPKLEMNTVLFKKLSIEDMDAEENLNLWHFEKRYNAINFKMTQKARPLFMALDDVLEISENGLQPLIRKLDPMMDLTANMGDAAEIVLSGRVNMSKSKVDVVIPEIVIGGTVWQKKMSAQVKCSCTYGSGFSNSNVF